MSAPKPDAASVETGIPEVAITTLGEFIDHVTPDEPNPAIGRRRDTGVYRGASDAKSPLLTSLDRLGERPHAKADLEEHVLRNYIRYSRPYMGERPENEWEELISAQHHGVPTRLLDWTYSPLVAAFFATRPLDGPERDRAVWRLDWQEVHRAFHFPPIALLIRDLDGLFADGGHASPWQLFAREATSRPFACLVEPPSLDARIVAQAAAFTLCSDKSHSFDEFLRSHGLASALVKFVIPSRCVPAFRDQLDLVGVDERRLFPDLDGVAAAIRRYYA
ncbi:MAG TPA: FRG domain-containing protein [Gemmatimonadaceae bacterium]|nr:FRG domain-containing protein [Gemmatimonadaceae bacterium]